MRTSGKAAAATMRRWSREGVTGVKGYCLRVCRNAWDLPPDERSAIEEWRSIPAWGRHRVRWSLIPVGAPVFFEGPPGDKYGHVAIASGIPGFVWSSDAPHSDRIGLVHISWFRRKWRFRYLGYSSYFQNHLLPLDL